MALLTEQELHNLAMNIVGKDLESKGFEFLALKDKILHFVVVRAITFPDNANSYDKDFMQTIKDHAIKFEAKTYYAGVGLGNSNNYQQPLEQGDAYAVIYNGLQEV